VSAAASFLPLRRFQDAFAWALAGDTADAEPAVASLAAQPAFAVYRNTVMKGCIDALRANFPAVTRLVGEEWFRATAAVYAASDLPSQPSLLDYGGSFPEFLAGFPPAAELGYLPGVARLDRLWTESHVAADARCLDRAAFARLDPAFLGESRLEPHPAARWAWFDDAPVHSIWSRNREERADEGEIEWRAEGTLLTRPVAEVRWMPIDAAAYRFLEACGRGQTFAQAMDAALEADAGANLVRLVTGLLDAGAFARLTPSSDDDS